MVSMGQQSHSVLVSLTTTLTNIACHRVQLEQP